MSSSAGWVRVASGLRLVASAAAADAAKRGSAAAASAAGHGAEMAANARTAAAAAAAAAAGGASGAPSPSWRTAPDGGATAVPSRSRRRPAPTPSAVPDPEPIDGDRFRLDRTNGVGGPRLFPGGAAIDREARVEASAGGGATVTNYDDGEGCVDDPRADGGSSAASLSSSHADALRDEDADMNARAVNELQYAIPSEEREARSFQAAEEEESKDSVDAAAHGGDVDESRRLKEGRAVPSTRIGRAVGFASLGVGLAAGAAFEVASRALAGVTGNEDGPSDERRKFSPVANDANADRLAASLCRMRGAALKLGQMLSIQDETLLPPPLARALKQVRRGADAMPRRQLLGQLESQLGEDWTEMVETFDEVPFAAASIGQVHRITLPPREGSNGKPRRAVMKVQYPGVADSIESDLSNLSMLVKMTGLAPPGLFIDEVIRVGRDELRVECDYLREMKNQIRLKELVETDPVLSAERFVVPGVVEELTTPRILTTEYAPGGTIDKVSNLDQAERNRIARNILRLTMKELFEWRFMQTDPNWGNFLYDVGTGTTYLIDFGAAREYDKSFVDGYLRIVWASSNRDEDVLMEQSRKMGFLTGDENGIMLEAHKMSGFTVGEPFSNHKPFDFRGSNISSRISKHSSAFLQHRLTPPPEEVYTLHRKLAGAYMLCIKLGAIIPCRDLLEEVWDNHVFEEDHVEVAKKIVK